MIQLSDPYMTTGKTIALTRQTFVNRVMSLLFNTLSRFVKAFFPGLLISSTVTIHSDFEITGQQNKICHCFHFFPSICHEVMKPDVLILVS